MKRYNKYKASGIDWIGEIPEHWNTMKIKFYCHSISSGATPSTNNSAFWDGDIPWIPSGCCHDCEIKEAPKFITEEGLNSCSTQIIPAGTAVMAMTGATCSQVGYLTIDAATNQSVMSYIENKKVADSKFLFYLLIGAREYVLTHQTGGAQAGIDGQDCSNLIVPFVPLNEQERIVSFLDKKCTTIDVAISTHNNRLSYLQELRENIITNAVTKGIADNVPMIDSGIEWIGFIPRHWDVKSLKFLCRAEKFAIKTGPFGTQLKGEELKTDGEVRVYNQRNVLDNQFDSVQYYITAQKAKELSNFTTKPNDILITSRGTIGRCAILPNNSEMGILHPCLIAMRIDTRKYDLEWLKLFINDSKCFATNVFLNSNATTIDVIYTDTLKGIRIPVPPYDEQKRIVGYIQEKVSKIDESIEQSQKAIAKLHAYKEALIKEAVTGKRKI